ncbi:MAG TPA: hypothetical protein VH482_29185 [Thermomicrobiales bacterium]
MTFATSVARLHAELKRMGLDLQDMRAERHLELSLVADPTLDADSGRTSERPELLWREPIAPAAREIPPIPTRSRLRYFLDGTQRTLPGYFSSSVPIIASINAAAILRRDDRGDCRVAPGLLSFGHSWLVPLRTGDESVDRFVAAVDRQGGRVVDPLSDIGDPETYAEALGDFGHLVQMAYKKARELRQTLEEDLLETWVRETSVESSGDWVVVDGALRIAQPRMVGLVKSFTRQYLAGQEAAALLRLPTRHRTAAFRVHDHWWRDTPVTAWYLRMHDATGRDPRYALVRVETAADIGETAQIDEISAWLLAERVPRATADERWATLLYPVHYLEKILKRYLEAETRGWPSPR